MNILHTCTCTTQQGVCNNGMEYFMEFIDITMCTHDMINITLQSTLLSVVPYQDVLLITVVSRATNE